MDYELSNHSGTTGTRISTGWQSKQDVEPVLFWQTGFCSLIWVVSDKLLIVSWFSRFYSATAGDHFLFEFPQKFSPCVSFNASALKAVAAFTQKLFIFFGNDGRCWGWFCCDWVLMGWTCETSPSAAPPLWWTSGRCCTASLHLSSTQYQVLSLPEPRSRAGSRCPETPSDWLDVS